MSNQRKGNYQSKPDGMTGMTNEMGVLKFFKIASEVLEGDEGFYFNQVVDWLKSGKSLPKTQEDVIKCLGL
jgi:hypothetical protein